MNSNRSSKTEISFQNDRKRDGSNNDNNNQQPEKKLLTTIEYIYQTMFLDGQGSDVTIDMLGKKWKLHKTIISRSPYFDAMFSGSWRESNAQCVTIPNVDSNMTQRGLFVVFGSLYSNQPNFETKEVVQVLSAATLFQLQALIDQCVKLMEKTLNDLNAVSYLIAAEKYALDGLKLLAMEWFDTHLVSNSPSIRSLNNITPEMMVSMLSRSNLILRNTEMSVYLLLKSWLYSCIQNQEDFASDFASSDEFFKNRNSTTPVLDTAEVSEYLPPFQTLKIKYLLLCKNSSMINVIEEDNILPREWIFGAYKDILRIQLQINNKTDQGPQKLSEEDFDKECHTCCLHLQTKCSHGSQSIFPGQGSSVFLFGVNLRWYFKKSKGLFVRMTTSEDAITISSNHRVMMKASIINVGDKLNYKIPPASSSGLKQFTFMKDREEQVIPLGPVDFASMPTMVWVSVKILVHTPSKT